MIKPSLSPQTFYLSFFLHAIVASLVVAGDSSPIYSAVEDITVKCGFSGKVFNEYDGRNWTGDIDSEFSPFEHEGDGNRSISKDEPQSHAYHQRPYTTVRLSRSEFTYRFKLTTGQKFIRLYFYPASYDGFDRSKALFSVKAGRFSLLRDFNASVTADANPLKEDTIGKEFCLNIEEGVQSLNITFTPSRASPDAYAFINGIEIVSMPANLYYTAPEAAHGIEYVGNENTIRIENTTALENVYRINIGGNSLSFKDDTGMYRNWDSHVVEEEHYLDAVSLTHSVLPQNVSLEPNFSKIPEYSAPKQVYQTGRSMGQNKTINQMYNLSWVFHVDPNFQYLVRLHFCEFESLINETRDRVFLIYVENILVEEMADILVWSGGNGIPTYRDYLVFIPAVPVISEKKANISIILQAYPKHWFTLYLDAILNGLEIFKLSDTNGNLAGPNPDLPLLPPPRVIPLRKQKHKSRTLLFAVGAGVVLTTLIVLSVLGYLLLVFRRRRNYVKGYGRSSDGTATSTKSRGSSLPSDLCRYFSLAEIKAATQNFNDIFIIGVGGFGHVYKGYIDGGATVVAIKRLKPESSQGAIEFQTEIEMLSQLRHLHLVSLIGYCRDQGEMILVYDYMARGTLREHLYNTENTPLTWEQRLQICIGAARGLHYLHTGGKYTIIHRDVKSTNILLDEKWVAKFSDFGLSKVGPTTMSKTHISTMVKGSFGYVDPEYYRRQQLTEKSDVYSFGVVLCEVLCARPALVRTVERKQMSLAEWTKNCHRNGKLDEIIDPSLKGKVTDACLNKFVEMAVSCMHDNGVERPSMNDVVWGLEFALQLHQKADVGELDFINGDKKGEEEVAFMSDRSDTAAFSSSCAEASDSKNSTVTNESIKGMSRLIFSGINDRDGR